MTKEEILSLKAGRELNIKIAEEVMGHKFVQDETLGDMENHGQSVYGLLQPYSEDIAAAWLVLEKLKSHHPRIEFNSYNERWEASFSAPDAEFTYPVASASTAPEAICKAALLALLEAKGK